MGAHSTTCLPETFETPPPEAWRSLSPHSEMRGKDNGDIDVLLSPEDETPAGHFPMQVRTRGDVQGDMTPEVSYHAPSTPEKSSAKELHKEFIFEVEEVEKTDPSDLLKDNGQLVEFSDVKAGRMLSTTRKSTVFLSTWQERRAVMKTIKIDVLSKEDPDSQEVRAVSEKEMLNEMRILSGLQHPCLVEFLGGNTGSPTCFVLLEYMEAGDLETYMQVQKVKSGGAPPPSLGRQWCVSIADALSFLHGRHIIHRDLKPLNLLLNQKLELKVTDFGISRFTSTDAGPAPMMSGGVGTWRYMAPEVVRYEQYTDRIDIFSFGLIMYFILTGTQPFQEFCKSDPELILKAYVAGQEPRPEIQTSMSQLTPALTQLMQDAWAIKASFRPSAEECLERLQSLPQDKKSGGLQSYWRRAVSEF